MVEVSDTGLGMSAAVQEHIFEPFYTTKETGKGTGLGLSIIYGIVKDYGGEIRVDSREGEGTTFRLSFPGLAA
jgi:two-component system cell cycle sensor histidine kinase/response regulator CckA